MRVQRVLLIVILLSVFSITASAVRGLQISNDDGADKFKRLLQSDLTCTANACEICTADDQTRCQDCLDDFWTEINDDGDCECIVFVQKPNIDGICESCFASGCSSCELGDSENCRACIDSTTSIQHGHCYCPEGSVLNGEGICHTCNVPGCEICSDDVNVCQECIDDQAIITGGQCQCEKAWQKPNSFGMCSFCFVEGCASCTWDSSKCYSCLDSSATLVEGKCVCPDNMPMTLDGICQECSVDNCQSCVIGSPNQCQICMNTYIKNDSHACECPSNRRQHEGSCLRCELQHCIACITGEDSEEICTDCQGDALLEDGQCYVCDLLGCDTCSSAGECGLCVDAEETTIVEGECICHHAHELPNSEGMCGYCFNPGCLSCQASQQNLCSLCKDETASIRNGTCFCPEGTYIDEDEMCSSCLVVGCAHCADGDPYTCTACVDTHNTTIVDGQCVCEGAPHMKPNGFGECTYCFVDGCDSCRLDANTCYRCQEGASWVDGQCECTGELSMVEGRCQCPPGYSIVESNKCQEDFVECGVDIKGCEGCSEAGVCAKCVDRASLVDNACNCDLDSQKLSYETSQCSNCFVVGCASCSDADPEFCHVCIDSTAILQDGKCTCPSPQHLQPDGMCGSCGVSGCAQCVSDDPSTCQVCISGATESAGGCVCDGEFEKMNSLGECSLCLVSGCASCTLNMNVCAQCMDDGASIVEGECVCLAESTSMNADYQCQVCYVQNCEYCVTGDSSTCGKCKLGSLNGGQCDCSVVGQSLNTDGYCSACDVPGCISCYAQNPNYCALCESEFELKEGLCWCEEINKAINQNGECSECEVADCFSCDASDPASCLYFDDSLPLVQCTKDNCQLCSHDESEGTQNCLGCVQNYFVDMGSCARCPVAGCDVCASKFLCQTCIDRTAHLIDGLCVCGDLQKPATSLDPALNGMCSFCYVPGCASCGYGDSYSCELCTDPRALLIDNQCVCPTGEVFDLNGKCGTCKIPGCVECSSDGNTCLKCGGQTTEVDGACECDFDIFTPNIFGVCEECYVHGCSVCSADSESCSICLDDNAFNSDGECQCPDNYFTNSDGLCELDIGDFTVSGARGKTQEEQTPTTLSSGSSEAPIQLTSQSSSEKAIIISLAAVIVLLVVIGIVGFFYMRKKLLREGAADAPAVSSEVNFSETKKSSEDGTVIAPKKAETENRMIVDAV